jgi:ACR3 family arsenite efflux pump ArsB
MNQLQCSNCNGFKIKTYSSKRYLIFALIYLAFTSLFWFFIKSAAKIAMYSDDYAYLGGAFVFLVIPFGIAFLVKLIQAIVQGKDKYKCRNCGYKF